MNNINKYNKNFKEQKRMITNNLEIIKYFIVTKLINNYHNIVMS